MKLKELAQLLGLSQTTVSRALNGYPEVSETTRARVLAAAHEHGYSADIRARALATGRSMRIGHVIPISDRNEMVNPVFADFIAGAAEAYQALGYDIALSVVPDAEVEAHYRTLARRGNVDGVILQAPRPDDRRIGILTEAGLPFVVHGRASAITAPYSWVDVDNRRAFRRATEFLADLGHRRIALLNGREDLEFAQRRRGGYLDGLAARCIDADPSLMHTGDMSETYGHDATLALLDRSDPPSAILASSAITAFGIRRAATDRGLTLGRDLSVITHDDDLSFFRLGGHAPIFTSLRASVRLSGRRAGEALLALIDNPGEISQTLLRTDFVIGQSTGPAVAATAGAALAQES